MTQLRALMRAGGNAARSKAHNWRVHRSQRAGLMRLLAIVALFLGMVSMHHLTNAQCDETAPSYSATSAGQHESTAAMPMAHSSHESGIIDSPATDNLLIGCACLLAMCLAILAFLTLLRPQSPKDWLRVRERTLRNFIDIRQLWPPGPPDLLALSVSRT